MSKRWANGSSKCSALRFGWTIVKAHFAPAWQPMWSSQKCRSELSRDDDRVRGTVQTVRPSYRCRSSKLQGAERLDLRLSRPQRFRKVHSHPHVVRVAGAE